MPFCPRCGDIVRAGSCAKCGTAPVAPEGPTDEGMGYDPCTEARPGGEFVPSAMLRASGDRAESRLGSAAGVQRRAGSVPFCAGCGREINDRAINALDAKWHMACFKCVNCDKAFNTRGGSVSVVVREGAPWCEGCTRAQGANLRSSAPESRRMSTGNDAAAMAAAAAAAAAAVPRAVAEYDFEAQDATMLSLREGEEVVVVDKGDDGWWTARKDDGSEGLVPEAYVRELPAAPAPAPVAAPAPQHQHGHGTARVHQAPATVRGEAGGPGSVATRQAAAGPGVGFRGDEGKDRCAHCGGVIRGQAYGAFGRFYCENHFMCTHCGESIDASEGYRSRNEQPYHDGCFRQLFGANCAGCGEPLSGKVLNVMGKKFHPTCLQCHYCRTKLVSGSLFERDGQIACRSCKSASIGLNDLRSYHQGGQTAQRAPAAAAAPAPPAADRRPPPPPGPSPAAAAAAGPACGGCGAGLRPGAKFCPECGASTAAPPPPPPAAAAVPEGTCTGCGVVNSAGAKFCRECGTRM